MATEKKVNLEGCVRVSGRSSGAKKGVRARAGGREWKEVIMSIIFLP